MIDLSDYRAQIESALAYSGGTHVYEDVLQGVIKGRMQAWVNGESIAITEIIVYPRKKVLNVFLAAGNMREILDMVPSAAEWGKAQGCDALTLAGRKGWLRLLGRRGWNVSFYVLEASL